MGGNSDSPSARVMIRRALKGRPAFTSYGPPLVIQSAAGCGSPELSAADDANHTGELRLTLGPGLGRFSAQARMIHHV